MEKSDKKEINFVLCNVPAGNWVGGRLGAGGTGSLPCRTAQVMWTILSKEEYEGCTDSVDLAWPDMALVAVVREWAWDSAMWALGSSRSQS